MCVVHGMQGSKLRMVRRMSIPLKSFGSSKVSSNGVFKTASSYAPGLSQGSRGDALIVDGVTINASPRDPWDNPGAYEEAVLNTPLLETFDDPKDFKGIDILRTIRSFDPCMPCTTHIYAGDRVISREINTCACGADDEHEH